MTITVYGTTTCPDYAKLRDWLGEKDVDYTGLLVDKNPYAASKLNLMKDDVKVPFTTIEYDNGSVKTFKGFCPDDIESAINC